MENRQLALYLAKTISNGSKYYQAYLSKTVRVYIRLRGDRKSVSYRHGIIIQRYYDTYWLKARAFIFLPDIVRYVRHHSVCDKEFGSRVLAHTLTPDDIETMIHELTYGRIKLYMKGRKVFTYEPKPV